MVKHAGPGKKPTSAYGFFVKMCYEEHKKKYPNENVQVTEISKKCSEKWKTMTDAEKRRFYELAQKDTERYHAELAAYGEYPKRKRQKKDPNAPKRALSAFFFFSQERRPSIQQAHPDFRVGQVAQELGKMWKEMTAEEKGKYEEQATRDRERYEVEMKDFKAGKPVASRVAAAAAAAGASAMGQASASSHQAPPPAMAHQFAPVGAAGMPPGMQLPPQYHQQMQQMMQQQMLQPQMMLPPQYMQQPGAPPAHQMMAQPRVTVAGPSMAGGAGASFDDQLGSGDDDDLGDDDLGDDGDDYAGADDGE